jgi:hypothetical protein
MPKQPIDIYFSKDSFLRIDQAIEGYNMSERWCQTTYKLRENGKLLSLYKKENGLGRTMVNNNLKIISR